MNIYKKINNPKQAETHKITLKRDEKKKYTEFWKMVSFLSCKFTYTLGVSFPNDLFPHVRTA